MDIAGDISIITIRSPTLKNPIVFDVYRNPMMYMEGQLHRIFQAEKLIKVVHDCKDICIQLKKAHHVTCNAMFDTQVAYTLQMEMSGLPPRLIRYEDLHKNLVGTDVGEVFAYVKVTKFHR